MRTLWIVSGGVEAVPGIRRARELGCRVVVSDANPDCPGAAVADGFVRASTYDVEETIAAARAFADVQPLHGVLCVAADVPLTVASVAEALGLPGIPVAAARLAADKLAMKERFAEAGVPIPWFHAVESLAHLEELRASADSVLVLKPVDSRGARGVLRLTPDVDSAWAHAEALRHSPSDRLMVEEYLEGPQISTESVLLGADAGTPGFSDRNYELLERFAPAFIEDGGHQPTALDAEARAAVASCAEAAARALGIERGTAKGDLVWTPEGPKVIEIAARLSGGWFCTDQIPLATGVDLLGIAIRLALGDPVEPAELAPSEERGVAIRYAFPEPGVVQAVRGREQVESMPGVHALHLFVEPGDTLHAVSNHTQRAACVITVGDDREQAIERARQAVAALAIETA